MVSLSIEGTSSEGDKGEIGFGDQGENEIVDNSHVVSSSMLLKAALVFVQSDIARVMKIVLNMPAGAQYIQQLGRGGLFSR